MKRHFTSITFITWLALGLVMVWMILMNIHPIRDPDIWWHLASGRYMVQHSVIPKTDVFSLSAQGTSWVDTYWLQDILIYGLTRALGLNGLTMANAFLVAAFVFCLGIINPMRKLSPAAQLAGVVWIFMAGHPRGFGWGEKASVVTFGFLGLLFYMLRSKSWPNSSKLLKAWPFLFFLWANMHRGFILGLAILALHVLEEWRRDPAKGRRLGVHWLLCLAATFINPYGYHVYGMGWQDFQLSPVLVMGWAQTPFHHLELFWITLVLFWSLTGWTLIRTRRLPDLAFLGTSAALSALSMRYASLYPYFVIWAVPWLLAVMSENTSLFNQNSKSVLWGETVILILAILQVKPSFGINQQVFPVHAVEFLKENDLRVPFYHEYELGGFYLWELEGRPPVLIDGRYPAVQGYQHLFPEMQKVIQGTPEDFDRFLNPLNLHCAVVKYPSTQFLPAPFSIYFPRTRWALIYWDDVSLVFVQRRAEFQKLIQKYEFPEIQPDADPRYWKKKIWDPGSPRRKEALRAEILRNIKLHPASRKARFWMDLVTPDV